MTIYFAIPFDNSKIHNLDITYKGKIREDLRGFYRSSYQGNKWIYSTHLWAMNARTVFPSFDEPSLKAKFTLSITTLRSDDKFTVLANMPVSQVIEGSNNRTHVFKETPLMSTYLIAFAIGELKMVSQMNNGVLYRIFNTENENDGKFALFIAQRVTQFFSTNFMFPYSAMMPKLDLIGIPNFQVGAMENWGLISFRTNLLLANNESSQAQIESVAGIVTHEIQHSWNGNLVTLKWWNHAWLNEGFPSYFSWFALDKIFPGWRVWNNYLVSSITPLMISDAFNTTLPLVHTINTPSDVNGIFGVLAYNKGSALIRMLQAALGENFLLGWMSEYFKKYQFKNADTSDFLSILKDLNRSEYIPRIESWIYQSGYPIVTVVRHGSSFILKQERFFSSPKLSSNATWWIPISLFSNKNEVRLLSLTVRNIQNSSRNQPLIRLR